MHTRTLYAYMCSNAHAHARYQGEEVYGTPTLRRRRYVNVYVDPCVRICLRNEMKKVGSSAQLIGLEIKIGVDVESHGRLTLVRLPNNNAAS